MSDNWENWKSPRRDIRGMTWSSVQKMELTAESHLMHCLHNKSCTQYLIGYY